MTYPPPLSRVPGRRLGRTEIAARSAVRHRAALAPEVEIRDDVEQGHAEGDDAREGAEPREHERALVPARRRRGDSKHEVKPAEYFCEEFDHGAPEEMRRYGASSVGHRADFFFDFRDIHHDDGVPRAAIEEASVGAFAEALLAADALDRVDLDAPERWIVLIRHPEHAIFHGTVFHAGRRSSATGAALRNDGKLLRLFLARGEDALRARLKLLLVGHHSGGFDNLGLGRHPVRFYLECQALQPRFLQPVCRRELSEHFSRFRGHSGIRHAEDSQCRSGDRRCILFAQPRYLVDRGLPGHSGCVPYAIPILHAALSPGLLPRSAGYRRATLAASTNYAGESGINSS